MSKERASRPRRELLAHERPTSRRRRAFRQRRPFHPKRGLPAQGDGFSPKEMASRLRRELLDQEGLLAQDGLPAQGDGFSPKKGLLLKEKTSRPRKGSRPQETDFSSVTKDFPPGDVASRARTFPSRQNGLASRPPKIGSLPSGKVFSVAKKGFQPRHMGFSPNIPSFPPSYILLFPSGPHNHSRAS